MAFDVCRHGFCHDLCADGTRVHVIDEQFCGTTVCALRRLQEMTRYLRCGFVPIQPFELLDKVAKEVHDFHQVVAWGHSKYPHPTLEPMEPRAWMAPLVWRLHLESHRDFQGIYSSGLLTGQCFC